MRNGMDHFPLLAFWKARLDYRFSLDYNGAVSLFCRLGENGKRTNAASEDRDEVAS